MRKQLAFLLLALLPAACAKEDPASPASASETISLRSDCDAGAAFQSVEDLILSFIDEGILTGPTGNGLLPQLESIRDMLDKGKTEQALTHLDHFLRRLDQLARAGVLTEAQRAQLAGRIGRVLLAATTGRGTLTDARDGKTYRMVLLADCNVWMADNLSVDLPGARFAGDDPATEAAFGRLYPFALAQTACPAGWRLPTLAEWNTIRQLYGPDYATMIANLLAPAYGGNGSSGLDIAISGAWVYHPGEVNMWFYPFAGAYWAGDDTPWEWGPHTGFYNWNPPVVYNLGHKNSALACRCVLE